MPRSERVCLLGRKSGVLGDWVVEIHVVRCRWMLLMFECTRRTRRFPCNVIMPKTSPTPIMMLESSSMNDFDIGVNEKNEDYREQ
jgi:hypothetical protein